jgi:hypothetical protein
MRKDRSFWVYYHLFLLDKKGKPYQYIDQVQMWAKVGRCEKNKEFYHGLWS